MSNPTKDARQRVTQLRDLGVDIEQRTLLSALRKLADAMIGDTAASLELTDVLRELVDGYRRMGKVGRQGAVMAQRQLVAVLVEAGSAEAEQGQKELVHLLDQLHGSPLHPEYREERAVLREMLGSDNNGRAPTVLDPDPLKRRIAQTEDGAERERLREQWRLENSLTAAGAA